MQINRQMIVQYLRNQHRMREADTVEQQLPEQVMTDRDGPLLTRLGVDVKKLVAHSHGAGGMGDMR